MVSQAQYYRGLASIFIRSSLDALTAQYPLRTGAIAPGQLRPAQLSPLKSPSHLAGKFRCSRQLCQARHCAGVRQAHLLRAKCRQGSPQAAKLKCDLQICPLLASITIHSRILSADTALMNRRFPRMLLHLLRFPLRRIHCLWFCPNCAHTPPVCWLPLLTACAAAALAQSPTPAPLPTRTSGSVASLDECATDFSFSVAAGTTIGSIRRDDAGCTNLDFASASGETCTAKTYTSAATCTLNVTFTATAPARGREGGVFSATGSTGTVLGRC